MSRLHRVSSLSRESIVKCQIFIVVECCVFFHRDIVLCSSTFCAFNVTSFWKYVHLLTWEGQHIEWKDNRVHISSFEHCNFQKWHIECTLTKFKSQLYISFYSEIIRKQYGPVTKREPSICKCLENHALSHIYALIFQKLLHSMTKMGKWAAVQSEDL